MAITDELREYARAFDHVWFKSDGTAIFTTGIPPIDADRGDKHMLRIADRIDAEHERGMDDAWDNGYEADYLGIENWLIEHQQVMEHHGYIELPKDADGEYIRIGDVMAYADNTKPMEVVALVPPAVFLTEDGPRFADMCRHYHTPTVEDVLREFALACEDAGNAGPEVSRIAAEYASKLRLVGEGDE